MLVRAERRNTQRLNSSAMATTTASSPRLIHTVQSEMTRCVGSKMNHRFQFAQTPDQVRQTETGRARDQQTDRQPEQCRRQETRCEEAEQLRR